MAFIRVEKKKSGSYLRLVETYRESGKVRHKILASLGKAEDYSPEMLKRMGEKLYSLGGGDIKDLLGDDLEELARYNYGYPQVIGKAIRDYDLERLFNRLEKSHKLSYKLSDVIKLLLCERLCDPVSKYSSYTNQQDYLGLDSIALQHIYRSLDYLCKYNTLIQGQIFQKGRDLFNQQLDVVFYDVTTFYFESEQESGLRQKGFSKDGKQGKVQTVFGLLIDKDKNPIGYHLYKGDQYEGHTLQDALVKLRKTYQIDKVILVADRGMLNEKNLEKLPSSYEFIMGEGLRVLPQAVQQPLLELNNYTRQWVYNKQGESIQIRYYLSTYKGRTLIATYSEKRARKDAAKREEKLAKAQKMLANPSLLTKKPARYFIKSNGKQDYCLDQQKIQRDQKYDGFLVISTNNQTLEPELILDHYRHLFRIEQTFRTFKTHLEVRPMFHWTDSGIEGHICLCYIAYTLQHFLLQKLKKAGLEISEHKLRKALGKMQLSLVAQTDQQYYLRSNNHGMAENIINKLGLPKLPNLTPKSKIISYLK